ncbi:Glycosyl transferase [Tumidithrix helvetica PCC 7403]|uniref:glycosyl transferase n=1 Tax=Tumidithrix helvetica TaxID=3457545 RepID=UPI003C9224D3
MYELGKKLKLGKIAYRLYYAPKGFIQRGLARGMINSILDYQAQKAMERSAFKLPPVPIAREAQNGAKPYLDIHFLSGKKFWYQTCFCAYSLIQHTTPKESAILRPIIYDDGSLASNYVAEIYRIFPHAQVISLAEIAANLDRDLPIAKFPHLRSLRITYPHLRKITDIHAGSTGWKLVLDSDMLCFQFPTFLIDWLRSPQVPCHMVDIETSYGYSEALMTELAQAPISPRLNVGICGLQSEAIDWEKLEFWCKTMLAREGKSYYQEQALVAMLMAGQGCAIAPAHEYLVMPDRAEAIAPQAVLHHYVANSKWWYFRHGWQHIVEHQSIKGIVP